MTEYVMSREVFDLLATTVEDRDGSSLRANYTGRGMWTADTCVGLVTDGLDGLVQFVVRVAVAALEQPAGSDTRDRLVEVMDQLEYGRTRWDSLGQDVIYYWPHLCVDGAS